MTDASTAPDQPADERPQRIGPAFESSVLTLAVLGTVVALLSLVVFIPRGTSPGGTEADVETVAAGEAGEAGGVAESTGPGGDDSAAGPSGGAGAAGAAGAAGKGAAAALVPDTAIDCTKGKNGGNTDTGVTAKNIKLGAATVNSGPGASFLQPVDIAMAAVVAKANRSGGICGRTISLVLRDSGWDAQRGLGIIQNLIQGEKVFALAVNPDSEGLNLIHAKGELEKLKVPVVGTDGLLISQYQDSYIFPIATPTASAMYAMAKSQCDSGLKKFSIVFETNYHFGREGAKAYNLAAKACTGRDIEGYSDPEKSDVQCGPYFCGILGGQASYNSQTRGFCNDCGPAAGAVLLEPSTASTWFANGGRTPFSYGAQQIPGALGTPQPLFTESFGQSCGKSCNLLRMWTGFKPNIEEFAGQPALQRYAADMKSYSPTVDVNNQFVEGGYIGMRLMVDALTTASSLRGGLTRANLVTVLNSMKNWDIGLTVEPLSWSPGNHFSQTSAHAFDEQFSDSGGVGWRYTGITIKDPDPAAVTR